MSTKHDGVTCNGCSRKDFRLRRYKCLICRDYDLCGTCFDHQRETAKHNFSHPMQCLITKADHSVFYTDEPSSNYCVQSFTCPICGQLGFTDSSLSRHVFLNHPSRTTGDSEVLCPFCAVLTEGDPNRQTHDLAHHFTVVHNLSAPTNGVSPHTVPSESSVAPADLESLIQSRSTSARNHTCRTPATRTRLSQSLGSGFVRLQRLLNEQQIDYYDTMLKYLIDPSLPRLNIFPQTSLQSELSTRRLRGSSRSTVSGLNSHNDTSRSPVSLISTSQSGMMVSNDITAQQDGSTNHTAVISEQTEAAPVPTVDHLEPTGSINSHNIHNNTELKLSVSPLSDPTIGTSTLILPTTTSNDSLPLDTESCTPSSSFFTAMEMTQDSEVKPNSIRCSEEGLQPRLNSLTIGQQLTPTCQKSVLGDLSKQNSAGRSLNEKEIDASPSLGPNASLPQAPMTSTTSVYSRPKPDEWDTDWHLFLNNLIWASLFYQQDLNEPSS